MKRYITLALSVLALLLLSAGLVSATGTRILFSTDFDEEIGEPPISVEIFGGEPIVTDEISTPTDNRSVKLTHPNPEESYGGDAILARFIPQTKNLVLETNVYPTGTNRNLNIIMSIDDEDKWFASYGCAIYIQFDANGKLRVLWRDRMDRYVWREAMTYTPNQWYKVRIEADIEAQQYNLYVNDRQVYSDAQFYYPQERIDFVVIRQARLEPTFPPVPDVYVDNLVIWTND